MAAACTYLGASLGGKAAVALLYVIAGIGVIVAWVIVWMPIEELLFDWRPPAHVVAVFGLLSRARLEFIRRRTRDRCAVHSPGPEDPSDTAHRGIFGGALLGRHADAQPVQDHPRTDTLS